MRWINRALDGLQLTTIVIASVALVSMTGLMFVTTVLRYFMGSAIDYTNVILTGLMVYITFLTLGSVTRQDGHIRISLLADVLLKERASQYLRAVENIVATPLCIWMTWVGIDRIQFLIDQDARYLIGVSDSYAAWIPNIALPIGFGLAALFYVERTIRQAAELVQEIRGGRQEQE